MKLDKGKIIIELTDLLDSMTSEAKIELIETLSCDEAIIKHVADQILTGFTENIYSGAESFNAEPKTALDSARARVIELAPEVAAREVERLRKIAIDREKVAKEADDRYWALYHAWPKGYSMPKKGKNF
jgi:hypothetical protein